MPEIVSEVATEADLALLTRIATGALDAYDVHHGRIALKRLLETYKDLQARHEALQSQYSQLLGELDLLDDPIL